MRALKILALTALVPLAACSANQTLGEQLTEDARERTALAETAVEGERLIERGERLVKRGQRRVRRGEREVSEGRELIARGERQLRDARRASNVGG